MQRSCSEKGKVSARSVYAYTALKRASDRILQNYLSS